MASTLTLPLFPLPDVVHFPQTELRLHIFEPRYRQLVKDLSELTPGRRLIGMLLLHKESSEDPPTVYGAGTAGRMVEVEGLPDGRSNIRLFGGFRFQVEREVEGKPYRQGIVRPWNEPTLHEDSAELSSLHSELTGVVRQVAHETGERFPLSGERLEELHTERFEVLVNSLAAELDLPPLRKLQLLSRPVPERARDLLSILASRKSVLERLRPFRHLVGDPDLN